MPTVSLPADHAPHIPHSPLDADTFRLKQDYDAMMADSNAKLAASGAPPEADWATFKKKLSDDELWRSSSPLSRILHSTLASPEANANGNAVVVWWS